MKKIEEIIAHSQPPWGKRIKEAYSYNPIRHHIGFAGKFRLVVVHGPTGLVKHDTGWFNNLITNSGLDGIGVHGAVTTVTSMVAVGTDNTAPSVTDIALGSQVGARVSRGGSAPAPPANGMGPNNAYYTRHDSYQFAQGAVVGNITEVGLFSAPSGGNMWTRQVLPAAIVFDNPNTDILQVFYQLRFYIGHGDPNAPTYWDPIETEIEVVTNPVGPVTQTTQVLSRAMDVDNVGIWQNSMNSQFAVTRAARWLNTNVVPDINAHIGNPGGFPAVTWAGYGTGNYYRDRTVVASLGEANYATGIGGISGFTDDVNQPLHGYFSLFNPRIPKDSSRVVTAVERLSWGRRDPTEVA